MSRPIQPPVVDASVAVKWVIAEDLSGHARALLRSSVRASPGLVAPALLANEVANAVYQRLRRGTLSETEAAVAIADARRVLGRRVELVATPDLPWEAYDFAKVHRLPAVYDSLYVVLAQRLGTELWTADQRLFAGLGSAAPWVRWLGDYPIT